MSLLDPISLLIFEPILPLFPKNLISELNSSLKIVKNKTPVHTYISRNLLFTLLLALTSLLGFLHPIFFPLLPISILFLFTSLFLPFYQAAQVKYQILDQMPTALLAAASAIQTGQTPEEAFYSLSKVQNPQLSEIFHKTTELSSRRRIDLGKSLQQVISEYGLTELDRMAALLSTGIHAGSGLHQLFNTVARDLLLIRELRKEQIENMRSLKYTLILSGVLLIPAILAYSIKVAAFVTSPSASLKIASQLSFFPLAIVLGFVISSFCDQEWKNAIIYIPSFLVIQWLIFTLI